MIMTSLKKKKICVQYRGWVNCSVTRREREKVLEMNQTNDGWTYGRSSSDEEKNCLRDAEVM